MIGRLAGHSMLATIARAARGLNLPAEMIAAPTPRSMLADLYRAAHGDPASAEAPTVPPVSTAPTARSVTAAPGPVAVGRVLPVAALAPAAAASPVLSSPSLHGASGMYPNLTLATVSDNDALAAVASLNVPPSQRPAIWRARWQASAALQAEFKTEDVYVSFMEGAAKGRVRSVGIALPRAHSRVR
jgi:hypothetical protein